MYPGYLEQLPSQAALVIVVLKQGRNILDLKIVIISDYFANIVTVTDQDGMDRKQGMGGGNYFNSR